MKGERGFLVLSDETDFLIVSSHVAREIPFERIVIATPTGFGRHRILVVARRMMHELKATVRLLRVTWGRRNDHILIAASYFHFSGLLVAVILRAAGRRVSVFLFNFYLHAMGERWVVKQILRLLLRGRTVLSVQSPVEVEYFRSINSALDIRCVPLGLSFPSGITEEDVIAGDTVFAGGYTNRDYGTLLAAAAKLPAIPFVIACSRANRIEGTIPANVTFYYDLSLEEFHRRLASSRIVVVPLLANVGASGQLVALAAMHCGKPVVYTKFATLAQYFQPDVSGIPVQAGDARELAEVLSGLYHDRARISRIGDAARDVVRTRFSSESFEMEVAKHILETLLPPAANAFSTSGTVA